MLAGLCSLRNVGWTLAAASLKVFASVGSELQETVPGLARSVGTSGDKQRQVYVIVLVLQQAEKEAC